jgi:RNA polymerase sigma-70 factor (ECF subfamily)
MEKVKRNPILGEERPGIADELEKLIATERSRLLRQAQAILHDPEEAEDVVQETLLAVWQQKEKREIRELAAYVSRAVYWNSLKRRARRHVDLSLDALPEATARSDLGASPDRLDAFELERAIASLPIAQQTVIRLRFYLGLTFREIGKNLSISANTAASRSRYALEGLRRKLRSEQEIYSRGDSE